MVNSFFTETRYQNNPLSVLLDFLEKEERLEKAEDVDHMRFVGYVLELGYDKATIITSDPYKRAVGGIPRGSFLIMAPEKMDDMPPHFTLLRVMDVAPTPLNAHVQQTYFELHKKSMPELDRWTQGELQWGALNCSVLGMFYPDPADSTKLAFSGDVNNVVSAHRYKVFSPNIELLTLIVNGIVKENGRFSLGNLRMTECQLLFQNGLNYPKIPVEISTFDFRGFRTAMFGKTRLGKSNAVKLIAQSMIESTQEDRSVGQLIFDINGEYANDNPQDDNRSLRSAYQDRCVVYALIARPKTPSNPLRLNFYEQPDSCIKVIASFLRNDNKNSIYVRSFASVTLLSIADIRALPEEERTRPLRRILYYWAILKDAGFDVNEERLLNQGLRGGNIRGFDPHFNKDLREAAYKHAGEEVPGEPETLNELISELKFINKFRLDNRKSPKLLSSSSKEPLFESDDEALLGFLDPSSGVGAGILRPYRDYHSPKATDFVGEILKSIDEGRTVILDLGNATDELRRYFADMLSSKIFSHQEQKFTSDTLEKHYVQLYFEEAHNLFPKDGKDFTGVYARFAKEGAKFHIGIVFSTQSPSIINQELLAQTENFFVGHLSSQDEAKALGRVQVQFSGLEQEIMRSKTPGYMRMLTKSHRFVIPVQTHRFEPTANG